MKLAEAIEQMKPLVEWLQSLKQYRETGSSPHSDPYGSFIRVVYKTDLTAILTAMQGAKDEIHLATHKCITCGVVATHPDEAVWNGGIYAGEWNSPQADDVRKLRRERDALAAKEASDGK